MSGLAAKARRLRPVFPLDVVDDRALVPCQKCGNDEGHALALPCGCKSQHVLSTVVAQVVKVSVLFVIPTADIHSLLCIEKTCSPDVLLGGPACRTVQVLGVLRESLGVAEIENKKDSATGKCSDHDEKSAKQ